MRERRRKTERGRRKALFQGTAGMLLWAGALCLLLRAALLPACAEKAAALTFPLDTAAWRVSDPYGWRTDPFDGKTRFHEGVDLACAEGTPVLAAMDGVAASSRRSASYGNCLRVRHADGKETLYAHLQYLYVRAGEVIEAGQVIGTAGQTGRATGPHLHFELWERGERCDPGAALGLS